MCKRYIALSLPVLLIPRTCLELPRSCARSCPLSQHKNRVGDAVGVESRLAEVRVVAEVSLSRCVRKREETVGGRRRRSRAPGRSGGGDLAHSCSFCGVLSAGSRGEVSGWVCFQGHGVCQSDPSSVLYQVCGSSKWRDIRPYPSWEG